MYEFMTLDGVAENIAGFFTGTTTRSPRADPGVISPMGYLILDYRLIA